MTRKSRLAHLIISADTARASREEEQKRNTLVKQGRETGSLDLEQDDSVKHTDDQVPSLSVGSKKYDPEKHREDVRKWIAVALLGLLAILMIGSFIMAIMIGPTLDSLKDVMTTFSAPLFGIIGTALGYYFGSEAKIKREISSDSK